MAYIKTRHNKLQASVRIPKSLEAHYGGKLHLYRTLEATDMRAAKIEAMAWEAGLKAEWEVLKGNANPSNGALRQLYDTFRSRAGGGEYCVDTDDPSVYDEVTAGIDHVLDRMADDIGQRELTAEERVKVAALNDARAERMGRRVKPPRELEPSFHELSKQHMHQWRMKAGRKPTNTAKHKEAIFDLFASYFGDRPMRLVTRAEAARFLDGLRELAPQWGRAPEARSMTWAQLVKEFGGHETGLSDATMNRHARTLVALWDWAEAREYCEGRNPFKGHSRALKPGRNVFPSVEWTPAELQQLFSPPPAAELAEIMLVAMHTGMRLNEIASLTYEQLVTVEGVSCIDITEAKSEAGVRKVPVHAKLSWLLERKGDGASPIWPKFTQGDTTRKPGQAAGKLFTRHKQQRGFENRLKVFHSFRKNVVGQLELAGIPQNEAAQLVGHEKKGLTFSVYGKALPLARRAEIINLIEYPDITLPVID